MVWKYKGNEPKWCTDRKGTYHFVFNIDSPDFDDPEFYQCACGLVELEDSFLPPVEFPETTHCSTCCSLISAFEASVLNIQKAFKT